MVRRNSRRDFLHVGFCGGIGLTLAQYLKMQQAQADLKHYESGGRNGKVRHLHLSAWRNGSPGELRSEAVCSD